MRKPTQRASVKPRPVHFMRTPVWCRKRAGELGADVAELINDLMTVNALHRLRACQGVIGLADKYDTIRLNAACRRAIDVGDPTYRTVKGILIAGTETDTTTSPPAAPAVPAHLHGPQRLFVIDDNNNDNGDYDRGQHDAGGGVDGDVIDLATIADIEVAS
jgi:hypothetical protein